MKRIISLLLCFTILCGFGIRAYAAEDSEYGKEYEVLSGLGMLPQTFTYSADEEITRGEFAQIAAAMVGYEESNEEKSYFTDLEKEYYASGAISYLYELDIISGYDNDTFRAGDIITYDEAMRILLGTMGFTKYTELYKNSYFPERKQLSGNVRLTHEQALWYIYEAMNTYYCNVFFSDSGKIKHTQTEETVLEKWSAIKRTEGIVSSVGHESIFDNGAANRFLVGDLSLRTSEPEKFDCLGFYCEVYYYGDDAENSDEVLYAQKLENRNKTVIINSDEMVYYNGRLNYVIDGKNKSIDISPKAFMVKNSKPADTQNIDQMFNIGDGIVTVNRIDHLDTEVVLVEEYKNYLISDASEKNFEIYSKNGASIVLDEEGQSTIRDEEDNLISIADIEPGTLASVMQSDPALGGVVTKAILSKETVNGTLVSYGDNEAVVDSDRYKVAKNIGVDLSQHIGSGMVFYINFNGKIAYAEIDLMGDFRFGYLCRVRETEDVEDSYCQIRIYAEDGKFHDYAAVEKLRIDRQRCESYDDVMTALKKGTGTDEVYQPIRFKLKNGSYVREIDTAFYNKAAGESEYSLQSIFKSYDSSHNKLTSDHLSDGMILDANSFENYASMDGETLKFKVPPQYDGNVNNYKVPTTLPEVSYWIDAYTANPEKVNAELVIQYSGAALTPDKSYLGVIERASTGLNEDDEIVYKLVMTGGTDNKKEYSISPQYSLKNLPNKGKDYIFAEYVPRAGDCIQYSVNDRGEIIDIVPYYSTELGKWIYTRGYQSGGTYWGTNDNTPEALVTRDRFQMGYLYKKYGTSVQIALGESSDLSNKATLDLRSMEITSKTKILKFNSMGKIEEISASELRPYTLASTACDKIMMITNWNELLMILVFEE